MAVEHLKCDQCDQESEFLISLVSAQITTRGYRNQTPENSGPGVVWSWLLEQAAGLFTVRAVRGEVGDACPVLGAQQVLCTGGSALSLLESGQANI